MHRKYYWVIHSMNFGVLYNIGCATMYNHDNSIARETSKKVLSNLIKIDMVRTALSTLGSSNSVNKTNLATLIYSKVTKPAKEK
jgi:hypothetical protein